MNTKDIPFIIPNFNQLYFLRNLVNQLKWYYPENQIFVVDNGSTLPELRKYYFECNDILAFRYPENDFVGNLSSFIEHEIDAEYYVISDPDLYIPPYTPPIFLEVFKAAIEQGYHHAGFGLKTDDIPLWNPKAGWIQGDEKALLSTPVKVMCDFMNLPEAHVIGHRAPIDTTFALYKRSNGGWTCPMTGEAWSNCIRLFEIYHMTWYLHKDYLNKEMVNYFNTVKKRELGKPTAGVNHYQPFTGME